MLPSTRAWRSIMFDSALAVLHSLGGSRIAAYARAHWCHDRSSQLP